MIDAYYSNGLERTSVGVPERVYGAYLRMHGIRMEHARTDWHDATTSYDQILDTSTERVLAMVRKYGRVVMIGASAGGSNTLNTRQRALALEPDADISAILVSAWLQDLFPERLEQVALHRPDKQPSPAFIESVEYCHEVTIPSLLEADKSHIITITPNGDETVPIAAMTIAGIPNTDVAGNSHISGILHGLRKVPTLVEGLYYEE